MVMVKKLVVVVVLLLEKKLQHNWQRYLGVDMDILTAMILTVTAVNRRSWRLSPPKLQQQNLMGILILTPQNNQLLITRKKQKEIM